jgi:peptidoglycan hydrolase-like protein with peptidoglycan-binding domain
VSAPGRRGRGRVGTVVLAATAVLVVAAAVVAAVGSGGAGESTADAGDLPPATATVTRQTLVDAHTADGELGYGPARTATGRLSGTVTALAATGSTVKRGRALYRVDDQPVVLLYGALPAYRTLTPGTQGADVRQFERNLAALGYDGFTVDDEYTWDTAEAVRQWQDDLGVEETGQVEPGRVLYARGAVRVDSHSAAVGDTAQPGKGVLTYTGTARVVTASLDVDDQRLARKGAAVSITMPDGKRAKGRITTVETVIETSTGANGQPSSETKIEVTVTADDPGALSGYDRASVDVALTAAERKGVLTVPVAALLALAEGGYGVQVVEGATTRTVAVETGLFASGRVEISGDGVAEGTTVGMPA